MPTGLDHVQATIALCQRLSASAVALKGAEEAWTQEIAARLARVQDSLTGMQERFFLRSKLCLPFAARCEQEAKRLEQALAPGVVSPQATRAAQQALAALEQATKVLDDRSNAQGMVIT
jgi:hypothetical protein